jgi:hypothetical protein
MGERRGGRGPGTVAPTLGWALALTEVALAAVPIPVALALHLREPSAVVAPGVAASPVVFGGPRRRARATFRGPCERTRRWYP